MGNKKEYEGRIVLFELGEYFAPKATKPTPIEPAKPRKRKSRKVFFKQNPNLGGMA